VRLAAGLLLLAATLLASGCVVVVATVASATAITATTIKTAGKVTTATVATGGKVTAAAVTSSGDVAALSMESAASLARTGMVVLVDGGSGAVFELPWREGLRLQQAIEANNLRAVFKAAKIFREGRIITARLKDARAAAKAPELRPGDVVELLR
jgi:hypothetical protein